MLRFLSFLLFIAALIFLGSSRVHAEDFKNDYKVEYFLNDTGSTLKTRVKFTVTLTNLRSDLYVNKMSLAFPKTFQIKNLSASDDDGRVSPELATDDTKIYIRLMFNDPNVGKNSTNTFYVEFDQENLFKVNGNVWEVILPTVEDKTSTSYQVVVHLPEDSDKKISIAKPKPDEIAGKTIIWKNPTARTIYAVFGDKQYYRTKLQYHLQNSRITPVITEVAFPPDTLYQKIYIDSIQPAPLSTYIDEDGNFMGRYELGPRQKLDVQFDGVIELFTTPRAEFQPFVTEQFAEQKDYLLTQKEYWLLKDTQEIASLTTPKHVFDFVKTKLSYSYERINKNLKRLGASYALEHPDQAVCMEFTDSFIAIAREKGIYSREIQGYGFSNDPQLRPLSLVSDVLHAWPEYYDSSRKVWIPVDPTWENTSGIDYFSSLDFNHVVFAIHGKRTDYPHPAGTYKQEESKDISILPVATKPEDPVHLALEKISLPHQITDDKTYKAFLILENKGNSYALNVPVELESDELIFSRRDFTVSALAPYEKRELEFEYRAREKNAKTQANVSVKVLGNSVFTGKLVIVPYYFNLGLKVGYLILGFSVVFFLVKLLRRKRK